MLRCGRALLLCVILGLPYSSLSQAHSATVTNRKASDRVDLHHYFDPSKDETWLTFAESGRSVCVWWWPHTRPGDFNKEPGEFLVFDVRGQQLANSREVANRASVLADFPIVAWRETCGRFLEDSVGWAFRSDLSREMRIRQAGPGRFATEMWKLPPQTEPLWSTSLPSDALDPRPVGLLFSSDSKRLIIATTPQTGVLMDQETGKIERSFSFGRIESDADAVRRRKRFRLKVSDADPSLKFASLCMACDPQRELLACGGFFDKRVRVIRIGSPGRVLFEANTDVNPALPKGGTWMVQRVEFLSGGKYLLTEYHFGGRGTDLVLEPTEIFDTATWKIVWEESDVDIRKVTLSPDGKLIALFRGSTLEIHRFEPVSNEATSGASSAGKK